MKIVILLILLLCLAWLCQGCVIVPLPASGKTVTAGTRISKAETEFVKLNWTTRAEITNKLGQPFAAIEEPPAIAYSWSVNSWNCFVIWPAPELFHYGSLADRDEALMFQFDRDDRVQRFEFKRLSGDQSVKDALCQWAETKPPN
jgi:hypothetical protein